MELNFLNQLRNNLSKHRDNIENVLSKYEDCEDDSQEIDCEEGWSDQDDEDEDEFESSDDDLIVLDHGEEDEEIIEKQNAFVQEMCRGFYTSTPTGVNNVNIKTESVVYENSSPTIQRVSSNTKPPISPSSKSPQLPNLNKNKPRNILNLVLEKNLISQLNSPTTSTASSANKPVATESPQKFDLMALCMKKAKPKPTPAFPGSPITTSSSIPTTLTPADIITPSLVQANIVNINVKSELVDHIEPVSSVKSREELTDQSDISSNTLPYISHRSLSKILPNTKFQPALEQSTPQPQSNLPVDPSPKPTQKVSPIVIKSNVNQGLSSTLNNIEQSNSKKQKDLMSWLETTENKAQNNSKKNSERNSLLFNRTDRIPNNNQYKRDNTTGRWLPKAKAINNRSQQDLKCVVIEDGEVYNVSKTTSDFTVRTASNESQTSSGQDRNEPELVSEALVSLVEAKQDRIAELENRLRAHKLRMAAREQVQDSESDCEGETTQDGIGGESSKGVMSTNQSGNQVPDETTEATSITKVSTAENDLNSLMQAKRDRIAELEKRLEEKKLRLLAKGEEVDSEEDSCVNSTSKGSEAGKAAIVDTSNDTENDADDDIQAVTDSMDRITTKMTTINTSIKKSRSENELADRILRQQTIAKDKTKTTAFNALYESDVKSIVQDTGATKTKSKQIKSKTRLRIIDSENESIEEAIKIPVEISHHAKMTEPRRSVQFSHLKKVNENVRNLESDHISSSESDSNSTSETENVTGLKVNGKEALKIVEFSKNRGSSGKLKLASNESMEKGLRGKKVLFKDYSDLYESDSESLVKQVSKKKPSDKELPEKRLKARKAKNVNESLSTSRSYKVKVDLDDIYESDSESAGSKGMASSKQLKAPKDKSANGSLSTSRSHEVNELSYIYSATNESQMSTVVGMTTESKSKSKKPRPPKKHLKRVESLSESSESSPIRVSPTKKSRLRKKPEHNISEEHSSILSANRSAINKNNDSVSSTKGPIVVKVKPKARPKVDAPNNSIMDSTINFYNTMFVSHSNSMHTSMRNESLLHNESTSSIRVRPVSARRAATAKNKENNLQNLLFNMSVNRR